MLKDTDLVSMRAAGANLQIPAPIVIRGLLELLGAPLPGHRGDAKVALAIGAHFDGGRYAGLTVHENAPHDLILLPDEFAGPWEKAKAWAAERGGVLTSRFDALVLFKNLKSEFANEYYWTSEEYTGYADFAWVQSFSYGYQDLTLKSLVCRCRAVRRVAI